MTNKITFYVPSTTGVADKVYGDEHVSRMRVVARFFSGLFGGATASKEVAGFWVAANGDLVEEAVIQVSSFCLGDNFGELVD